MPVQAASAELYPERASALLLAQLFWFRHAFLLGPEGTARVQVRPFLAFRAVGGRGSLARQAKVSRPVWAGGLGACATGCHSCPRAASVSGTGKPVLILPCFCHVQALVVGMLEDAKLEVREMAATTLSGEF